MNKLQNLISELEKHHKKKLDLSLGRTFNLLKKLGNPQDKLNNIITIVGTNAKASMSYSLKAILNQAGLKCNMYPLHIFNPILNVLYLMMLKLMKKIFLNC